MNATVILGSIPIFTKTGVGGALLTIEESGTNDDGVVGLQFGAGSWPERLKGFNRFGMTQEAVRLDHSAVAESTYMSFMTASRESNLHQAQRALHSTPDCLALTVARGRFTAAGATATILHETVASSFSWIDCPKLMRELREHIPPATECVTQKCAGPVLPTFLYAVRHSLLEGSNATTLYAHNAKVYCLRTEARRDHQSGEPTVVARTWQPGTHAVSEFKLWMASDGERDLPARIEFRPKSYLKLTLETDEAGNGPEFKPLFEEAQL